MYAVLDDQSDTCFVTNELCQGLGVSGPEITLELGTMHSVDNFKTHRIEGLAVSQINGDLAHLFPDLTQENRSQLEEIGNI